MKNNNSRLITGLLAVGLFFSFFQIYTLKNEMQVLRKRMDNKYDQLDRNINDIYSNVDYQLKKQADLLNEYSWEYISADIQAGTAVVRCSMQPKEYTTSTEAVIVVDGKDTPMSFENGEYTAFVTVPLYNDSVVGNVYFTDGNSVRSQKLNWGISPRSEFLTNVYAQFNNGGGTGSHNDDGAMIWEYSGTVTIDAERKGKSVDIQNVYLITEKNGDIINRQELSVKEGIENRYQNSNAKPEPDGKYTQDTNSISLMYEKQIEISLEKGSEVLLKTEVVDADGLHHITIIEGWRLDSDGNSQTYMVNRGAEAEIYSADGSPLFTYTDQTNFWW